MGVVFRYDQAERLKDTYYGVSLDGPNLETYGDPANTPTAYGKRTNYILDVRSNRTSVKDYDDALKIVCERLPRGLMLASTL